MFVFAACPAFAQARTGGRFGAGHGRLGHRQAMNGYMTLLARLVLAWSLRHLAMKLCLLPLTMHADEQPLGALFAVHRVFHFPDVNLREFDAGHGL